MRRAAIIAADAQSCYRPRRRGMAIYADGVPMTDRLLGLVALAIGGALGWLMFGPIMTATAARGVGVDTIATIGAALAVLLLLWSVVDLLRR
jgi:hypothetical protein